MSNQCPGWLQCPGPDGTCPFDAVQLSCPLSRITPPKHNVLVSSDHNTFNQFSSESFRCSLANFRRACTCAFLSSGTLRALQDFSPSWRSVLPIVFLVTMVPAALRSLTRSSRVVLGWFLTVLMIIETPRVEILPVPILDFWGPYAKLHLSVFHAVSNHARGRRSRNSISSAARYAFNSFFFCLEPLSRDFTTFTWFDWFLRREGDSAPH